LSAAEDNLSDDPSRRRSVGRFVVTALAVIGGIAIVFGTGVAILVALFNSLATRSRTRPWADSRVLPDAYQG
jgi:hypothetical protein